MRTVISASRRTDLPAHYYNWLAESFRSGKALVSRPYNRGTYEVNLTPDEVHTIVFWSKDFDRLLRDTRRWNRYHLFFQFTLNDCPEMEPNVPPLPERLEQLKALASQWGPERISWRFDPIVFWDDGKRNNLSGIERIAETAASCRIDRCTFSFMTHYNKTRSRGHRLGIEFYDPPLDTKIEVASALSHTLERFGIALANCCNPEMVGIGGIRQAHCIDGTLLSRLAGESCDERKDTGQRGSCGCTRSVDIGSYWMECPHACRYCYARPAGDSARKAAL
ncbi:MAG TPA: DUF1848 family protein [bacterium]|nr:DUF1848 family protein [bacterium]HQO33432.1 DUF1848 family protein [bacterium]